MKLLSLLGLLAVTMICVGWAQSEPLVAAPLLSGSAYGRIVKCALRDRAGRLWFATSWTGVFRYDGKTFTHFTLKDGLPSDLVNTVYEDSSGVLWFGTDKGVVRYDGNSFSGFPLRAAGNFADFMARPLSPTAPSENVTSIIQDQAGNLWFGLWGPPGSAGAYRYDGKQLTRFLPEKPTQGLVADDGGGVWLNSQRYDGQTFTDFSDREYAFKDAVFCSLKDRAGILWFGVRADGLYRFDGKSFTWFSARAGTFERVTCLFEDRAGRLWIGGDIRFGTDKGGLCYYDGKSFVQLPQIYDFGMYSVWTAAEDSEGNIWFAGRGGKLCRYDGKTFTDFSDQLR